MSESVSVWELKMVAWKECSKRFIAWYIDFFQVEYSDNIKLVLSKLSKMSALSISTKLLRIFQFFETFDGLVNFILSHF